MRRVRQQAMGLVWGRISEAHHCLHGDAVSSVEIHQTVEGAEGLVPYAVLAGPLQDSEMFNPVAVAEIRVEDEERENDEGDKGR